MTVRVDLAAQCYDTIILQQQLNRRSLWINTASQEEKDCKKEGRYNRKKIARPQPLALLVDVHNNMSREYK